MIPDGFTTKKSKNGSCEGCHFNDKNSCTNKEVSQMNYCISEDIIFIKEWFNSTEIAEHFKVSTITIGRWVKQGLPHKTEKPKGRFEQRIFRIEDVQKWIDNK